MMCIYACCCLYSFMYDKFIYNHNYHHHHHYYYHHHNHYHHHHLYHQITIILTIIIITIIIIVIIIIIIIIIITIIIIIITFIIIIIIIIIIIVIGILVPGGFGSRGIEGMIVAAKYAREKKIPYLGVCLGMQVLLQFYLPQWYWLIDVSIFQSIYIFFIYSDHGDWVLSPCTR